MTIVICEPDSGGRSSGGYRYNAEISRRPEVVLLRTRPTPLDPRVLGMLEAGLPGLDWDGRPTLLIDSLYLDEVALPPFLELKRRTGCSLGIILHAFPSFIRAASERTRLSRSLPLSPSEQELRLLSQLDFIVTPGPYVRRLLDPRDYRCVICPPGRDGSPPPLPNRPESGERRPLQLMSIGAVTPGKGFADGLRALSRIGAASFAWKIVGSLDVDPAHARDLIRLSERLGLAERVEWLGQRPHAETLALLAGSDWLLLPSYTENHPLVAREALAHGVPVVGYDAGGVADVVEHERSGLLAPLLDEAELAQLIERALLYPELRGELSRGALAAAARWPTWEQAREHFVRALRHQESPLAPSPPRT